MTASSPFPPDPVFHASVDAGLCGDDLCVSSRSRRTDFDIRVSDPPSPAAAEGYTNSLSKARWNGLVMDHSASVSRPSPLFSNASFASGELSSERRSMPLTFCIGYDVATLPAFMSRPLIIE